jgi:hypothetical protein
MKLACHRARALSRVAIIILWGVDELGIPIKINKKFGNPAGTYFTMADVKAGLKY